MFPSHTLTHFTFGVLLECWSPVDIQHSGTFKEWGPGEGSEVVESEPLKATLGLCPLFSLMSAHHEESMFSAMCFHHDVTPPRWTENNGPHSLKPLKAQSKTNFSFFKLFISSILSQWWKFYMPSTHLPMYLKGEMSSHDIVMASLTCSSSLSKFHSDTYTLSIQVCFGRSKLQGSVVD